jgi:DNA polymerase I-like protein with 3'-5' exonuclease and polymerase domains
MHVGTPHSRAKHFGPNLAQVPNPKKGSAFGTECRALFCAPEGWVLVACDQATLQDRGFAHYLAAYDDGAYARTLVDGTVDQHWHTATALGLVLEARDKSNKEHTVIREGSKVFRYGFLFGAGDLRAGGIIADIVRAVMTIMPDSPLCTTVLGGNKHPSDAVLRQIGRRAPDKFIAATPGLRTLRQRLSAEHRRHGWIEGLDSRRVPTGADYKTLNRIVTAAEAIICKRWLVDAYAELCARFRYGPDGDAYFTLWIHDELVVCCRPAIAEQVGELLVRHGRAAGDHYGFRVPLGAEFKIGRDWAGTPLEESISEIAAEPIAPSSPPITIAEEEVAYADDF